MLQEVLLTPLHCLSYLRACHSSRALHPVHHLHTRIVCHGFSLAGFLGDYLTVTYAKCGAPDEAWLISCMLPCRTVFSWSAIISAYADCGRSLEALHIHQRMADEGIEPNDYTFVGLLKACANACNLEEGRRLHADACAEGFASDVFVANTLVSMYGKCGKTMEAEDVFEELSQRDVVSWTAMISAYLEAGLVEKAFFAYRQMQEESAKPNSSTFVILLQACCCLADSIAALHINVSLSIEISLELAEACHVDAQRMGFISDVLLLNTLVTVYSKCGAVPLAETVFDSLHHPHIVSWNAILSAYIQQGEGREALLLYRKMLDEDISPEPHTVVFALQACSILAESEDYLVVEGNCATDVAHNIGVCLHEDACRLGYIIDVFVGTALLSMYGKMGNMGSAENVFVAMPHHDLASCNAMLTIYAEQHEGNSALRLFREMCEEGMSPDQSTFVACLQGCESLTKEEDDVDQETTPMKAISLEIVQALHSDALSKGFALDVLVANTILSAYGKLGAVNEVQDLFYAMSQRTVVSWTAFVSILAEHNHGQKALQLFRQMQEENICPNELTYVASLQACVCLGEYGDIAEDCFTFKAIALEIGQALHIDAWREGYMLNPLVNSALVSMYGRCGSFSEANIVFSLLPCFHTDTCNVMSSLYITHGEGDKALWLYRIMQQELVPCNHTTFKSIIQACSEIAYLQACYELHFHVLSMDFDCIPSMNAILVEAYGRSASIADAQDVFDKQPRPNVDSWKSCIAGYAGTESLIETLQLHENLKLANYISDISTLTLVLVACSRAGSVSYGAEHFVYMREEKESAIDLQQFNLILNLFGRAGDFNRVSDILLNMPMQPDLKVWSSVLGACRLHSHIELAECAFKHIVNSQYQGTAPYVLMLNMYADAKLQCPAEFGELDIEEMMQVEQ